jgi:hypothetical protein
MVRASGKLIGTFPHKTYAQRIIPMSEVQRLNWEERMVKDKLNRNMANKPQVLKALGEKKANPFALISNILRARKPMKSDSPQLRSILEKRNKAKEIVVARKKRAAELIDARAARGTKKFRRVAKE